MESTGDPILDLQAICKSSPRNKEQLLQAYTKLGWGVDFDQVLAMAEGTYIYEVHGLFYPREGTVAEVVKKALTTP